MSQLGLLSFYFLSTIQFEVFSSESVSSLCSAIQLHDQVFTKLYLTSLFFINSVHINTVFNPWKYPEFHTWQKKDR